MHGTRTTIGMRGIPALCILFVTAIAVPVRAETLSGAQYLDRLESVGEALEAEDMRAVRKRAEALVGSKVRYETGDVEIDVKIDVKIDVEINVEIETDRSLLGPLARSTTTAGAREHARRLRSLIDSLDERRLAEGPRRAPASPDMDLLERLRREEELTGPAEGGRLPDIRYRENRFSKWVAEAAGDVLSWIGRKIGAFFTWLGNFVSPPSVGPVNFGTVTSVARLIVFVLIVALIVACIVILYYVIRNWGGPRTAAVARSAGPARSSRDEDALSRTATEWERYAGELTAAGHAREAIRAWYHALLVTMFQGGLLHHRKGRTNWEYAYALAPELAWRARFMDVVRDFEREWYGRASSTVDAVHSFSGEARKLLGFVRSGER